MLNQVSPERMTYVTFQPKTSEPELWQNKQIGTAAWIFWIEERDGSMNSFLIKMTMSLEEKKSLEAGSCINSYIINA